MDRMQDIKRLRRETEWKFELKECKRVYEECDCDVDMAQEILKNRQQSYTQDCTASVQEARRDFARRTRAGKAWNIVKRCLMVAFGIGFFGGCIALVVKIDSVWIIFPSLVLGTIGLMLIVDGAFPKLKQWLGKNLSAPSGVDMDMDDDGWASCEDDSNQGQSGERDYSWFFSGGEADPKEDFGWWKQPEKENVWEDNSEDNDWLPEDE